MDDWEKFIETLLAGKEHFYSHLYMEDITDTDNAQAKRVCKDFKEYIFRKISLFKAIHHC